MLPFLLFLFFHLCSVVSELTCIGCPQGFFYDGFNNSVGICRRCPTSTTTFPFQNVTTAAECSCNATFTNVSSSCMLCELGTFKSEIGNFSCTNCPLNSNTLRVGQFDVGDCLCNPGFEERDLFTCDACVPGQFKSHLGDEACTFCPVDTFCADFATNEPTPCFDNSESAEASTHFFDCMCKPGFVYTLDAFQDDELSCVQCEAGKFNERFNQSACLNCSVNTFNPTNGASNQSSCLNCPANSASLSGSTTIEACICDLGFSGRPGEVCEACEQGKYLDDLNIYACKLCPANTFNENLASIDLAFCITCGNNKTSLSGSGSEFDCVCDAGFDFVRGESRYECNLCTEGKFSNTINTSTCGLCSTGTYNTYLGQTVCVQCADGFYSDNAGSHVCTACEPGKYQNTSVFNVKSFPCTLCPDHSTHELNNSTDINDCTCNAGFFDSFADNGIFVGCEECTPGYYCPGKGQRLLCPLNHFSEAGASQCTKCAANSFGGQIVSFTECLCLAGTEGPYHDQCEFCVPGKVQPNNFTGVPCEPCAVGQYQPNSGQLECITCPADSSTFDLGAIERTECTCNPQFHGPDGGDCVLCDEQTYCPGGSEFQNCPSFTSSKIGSHLITNCSCIPGYIASTLGVECSLCPNNFYCPGGLLQLPCSNFSNSPRGSSDITACMCQKGLWRGCIQSENGSFVNQDGACSINYHDSCFSCGEDVICINNTLLHCPDFSTSPTGSSHHSDCTCIDGYYAQTSINHH